VKITLVKSFIIQAPVELITVANMFYNTGKIVLTAVVKMFYNAGHSSANYSCNFL
jgi:hypothetical protein